MPSFDQFAQFAARADAAEKKIAELTDAYSSLGSKLAGGAGGGGGGDAGLGPFKKYFEEHLLKIREQIAAEHAEHVKTQEENRKLKFQMEHLKRSVKEQLEEITALKAGGASAAAPAKAEENKGGKKKKSKKKQKQQAKEAPKTGKEQEKKHKAALKEGGKKGQDISGLSDMGGVSFFHVSIDSAEGDMGLLDVALEGFNKPVDEEADDRKGGAGALGKALFAYDDTRLNILVHVPAEAAAKGCSLEEWAGAIFARCGAKVVSKTENVMKAVMMADQANSIYPIRKRDDAIQAGFDFLLQKKLVLADEESDDEIVYGDDDMDGW